jgi:ubiquinone/menaquinone biosynthesis C-methylase UbiE
MTTSPPDFSGNIDRFSGFADIYDKYRPEPPAILGEILCSLAQTALPQLVVDLGCGTGLSTRYWAEKAISVIGVEPSADMRHQAEAQTSASNISYCEGFSHQTNLPDHCADIITCSQALHWMEPQSTFAESARILRPGGVFAAYDYDWPPTTSHWEADAAYLECSRRIHEVEKEFKSQAAPIQRWEKSGHLERMRASGCFRFTKELVVHHVDTGNADRLIGLMFSQGGVMTLLKAGYSETQLGLDQLREKVNQALGSESKTWYWSSRVRVGVV